MCGSRLWKKYVSCKRALLLRLIDRIGQFVIRLLYYNIHNLGLNFIQVNIRF